jgi:hypothetical protein
MTATEKTARVARTILGLYMIVQMWEVKDVRGRFYTRARSERSMLTRVCRTLFGTDVGIDEQVEHP